MLIKRATKVELVGRGVITLNANDHVATGGEGSVYRKGNNVVKLYTDASKMQHDGMPEKIRRLAALQHEFIVSPRGLVLSSNGSPIGYYMDFAEGEPLTRVFTNDFRQREGFSDSDASKLVARMRETMQFAHAHQAIMVDPNELNWLTHFGKHDPKPQVLDVDSWVLDGKVPAKVPKMLSIRDWHAKLVSVESDWFAWGVVTFQVFVGIHPYKGTLDGYRPADLERRMVDNASVFMSGVRLNRAVRSFSCVPSKLLSWYEATFQDSSREVPPSPFDVATTAPKAAKVLRVTTTATTGLLVYEKLFANDGDAAVAVYSCGVALLASGRLVDLATKRDIGKAASTECEVVRIGSYWLRGEKDGNGIRFLATNSVSLIEETLTLNASGKRLVRYGNRLFLVTDQGLTELQLRVLGRPFLSTGPTWGVMVNSTKWFDGAGVQDAMGATFVIAPFGDASVAQVRVRELDGLRVVTAKAGDRFVAVVAVDSAGQYVKIELSFDQDYKSYSAWQGGAQTSDLNMACLPKGVGVTIVDDGELTIFVPSNGKTTKVKDKDAATDMALANWENVVVTIWNGAVWSIRMK